VLLLGQGLDKAVELVEGCHTGEGLYLGFRGHFIAK
jgi:hypothetical protein